MNNTTNVDYVTSYEEYCGMINTAGELMDSSFALIYGHLYDLIYLSYDDHYRVVVAVYSAPEFYGPNEHFEYEEKAFIGAFVYTYFGKDQQKEIDIETKGKELFKRLIAERLEMK